MSQILNEAVRSYLLKHGLRELSLGDSLERLRLLRDRDPEFRAAIDVTAKAEAAAGDPLQETVIRDRGTERPEASGPVQTRIGELMRG